MDNRPAWNLCAVGNIVKTIIDENGELKHGTKEFVGGAKVYLKGKLWDKDAKTIEVIGLTRNHRYSFVELPVEYIENVRFQTVYKPKIVELMDDWEFGGDWWHRTGEDKRDIKRFVSEWNEVFKVSEEKQGYVSLEELVEDIGCDREERVDFDFTEWKSNYTYDINELQRQLDSMGIVGRKIKDIRFISHVYNLTEENITETLFNMTEGYPKEDQLYLLKLNHVDDLFPIPLDFEMDEPVLIKFEDGDVLELYTPQEGYYKVGMNNIPWNADGVINYENANGSILFDLCKEAVVVGLEARLGPKLWSYLEGKEFIMSINMKLQRDNDFFAIVIRSYCHDYMRASVEDYPDHPMYCPFYKVKQGLFRKGKGGYCQ